MGVVAAPEGPGIRGQAGEPVLVVEDDPEVRQLICWLLEYEGYHVETAEDGEEALARAEQRRPSVVVLDLNLPALDGEGVAAALQSMHGTSLPILVVSSASRIYERARRAGAFASLRKPFDIEDLIRDVRKGLTVPDAQAA